MSDIETALRLTWSVLVAWLLPQKWWPSIAHKMSSLGEKLTRGDTTCLVASRMSRSVGLTNQGWATTHLAADLRGHRYEVAFQCLRGLSPVGWHPKIRVEGSEHIDEALQRGKGCVLWVAHFVFAPNIVKVGLYDHDYRVSHLSRPDHGFSSTIFGIRCLNPVRTLFENRFLAERITFNRSHPAAALMRARTTLNGNGIVSFTAGAWEGSSIVETRFGGGYITLAVGPVWLARSSGAPLLPVFATRTAEPDEFVVQIERPIDLFAAPSAPACFIEATRSFLQEHEHWISSYPNQWRGWRSLHDSPIA